MTDDIMIRRGEYFTLQENQKKIVAQIQAISTHMARDLTPFLSYSRRHAIEPKATIIQLEGITLLIQKLQELVEDSESIDNRMAELKTII